MLCEVFDLPEDDEYIQHEIAAIKHALAEEAAVQSNRALFKKDKLHTRRRILLAYFALFMNQMARTLHHDQDVIGADYAYRSVPT